MFVGVRGGVIKLLYSTLLLLIALPPWLLKAIATFASGSTLKVKVFVASKGNIEVISLTYTFKL